MVEAAVAGQPGHGALDDPPASAALIRPGGIVSWVAAPGLPADTAALATALRTWLGEPHTRTPNGQQGEPGQPAGRKSAGQRRGEV
ncbi:hypothetical protein AB0N31_04480 [Streptomyces sp. NPDC051051]|uniref:aromatic-ring hydroxylase C-terminal domain-containing protein n=1 Tax=Streptomyces sp. NPDC051051 TaxID=3155666 RepID=UPI0034143CF6